MNTKTLFSTDDPDYVAFQYGAPGKDLMPSAVMTAASNAFWSDIDQNYTFMQYGPALGDTEFLKQLQEFLAKEYKDPSIRQDCLAITAGASQSFSNIISLFTTHETKIIIENPTYFLALKVLEDHGFKAQEFVSIPTDHDGLNVDQLEAFFLSDSSRCNDDVAQGDAHRFKYLMYLVPTYSNPTGRTTSLERRRKLVTLARKHNVLVVCDDVYNLLPLSTAAESSQPPRLVSLDLSETLNNPRGSSDFGNVISNNSFSKIMAPGMRLGWIEGSPHMMSFLSKSGIMNSGGSPNHIVSGLVLNAMRLGGLKNHLEMLKQVYAERMNSMCDYLAKNFPACVEFERPEGGFFIWVILPKGHDAFEIQEANQGRNNGLYRGKKVTGVKMSYAPGRLFTVDPKGENANCLRLTFAFYEREKLLDGCARLCSLLKQVL
ncbi:pyridoxal phosphate-dependent transferase [Obelidium mucronatum]|nr:pyridoxal phosphate-dependent transferase [Obelidium mucronatum]